MTQQTQQLASPQEVVAAFEELVDRLPPKVVRSFGKKLMEAIDDVKMKGIERMEREFLEAECRVIFRLADRTSLPPEHMALVNQLRNFVQ